MSGPARARQPRLSIEVRREQVLDAALDLIVEDGYGAASMEAIARRVGIAKPVVYNAYGDRQSLLTSLLERQEQRAFAALAEAMPPRLTDVAPDEALMTWATTLATSIHEQPATWRLILLPADGTPAVVRAHVEDGRTFVLAQVRGVIEEFLTTRSSQLDAQVAAVAVLAMAEKLATLLIAEPVDYTPERVVGFARDALHLFTVALDAGAPTV